MSKQKDAFYFPHFCNARGDRKIRRVRKELGLSGYGIFFMLLEVLREQTELNFPMEDIDLLADEFGATEQEIRTVICNYELFEIEDEKTFCSPRLKAFLKPYLERSKRARDAAKKRWDNESKQDVDANALPPQSKCNASKVKESKVKESKVKENYGTFENVLLTDVELQKIKDRFSSSWEEKINTLSEGIESKGYEYKSHYATILAWDRKDKKDNPVDEDNPEWMNGLI